jgi:hypothetical protein
LNNLPLAPKGEFFERFPSDFMFQLSNLEFESLRSQFATSKRVGNRYLPFAFTEQGVAMLSGLLNTDTAIQVNIEIMRAFVAIRHFCIWLCRTKQKT